MEIHCDGFIYSLGFRWTSFCWSCTNNGVVCGKANAKAHKNTMANTPLATQLANVDEQFQAWQENMEKRQ